MEKACICKCRLLKKISDLVVVFYFRLPSNLIITWPEGDEVRPNEKRPAGKTIGLFLFLFNNAKVPSTRKQWFPFYSKICFRKIHALKSCLNIYIYKCMIILSVPEKSIDTMFWCVYITFIWSSLPGLLNFFIFTPFSSPKLKAQEKKICNTGSVVPHYPDILYMSA